MECKNCAVKPLTYGTKRFICCMCGSDSIASKESSDICLDCSIKYSLCMTCGKIVTKEVK